MKACEGFPEGHVCPVQVPDDRVWCYGCTEARQRSIMAGVPVEMSRVGVILEDFEAPTLECRCGGDALAPHHEESLVHRQMVWRAGPMPDAAPGRPVTKDPLSVKKGRAPWTAYNK